MTKINLSQVFVGQNGLFSEAGRRPLWVVDSTDRRNTLAKSFSRRRFVRALER